MLHKNIRGKSLHAPSNEIVENHTGATIAKMKVVAFNGMGTLFPQVQLAEPGVNVNFGVMQADLVDGEAGYITCLGFMLDVDTSAWLVETELYADASGNLSPTPEGPIVAIVIKSHATEGVLYVTGVAGVGGGSGNPGWDIDGNAGLDENINFIGTTDAVDFRIKTANLHRALVDKTGKFGLGPDLTQPLNHFHQKSHTGFAGSGLRQETFSLVTNANTLQPLYSIPVTNLSLVKIRITVFARMSDGSARAAFTRTGLFYRENSNVQAVNFWQTDFTEKSDPNFDIAYNLTVNEIQIRVKSSAITETFWTGHIQIESMETDA